MNLRARIDPIKISHKDSAAWLSQNTNNIYTGLDELIGICFGINGHLDSETTALAYLSERDELNYNNWLGKVIEPADIILVADAMPAMRSRYTTAYMTFASALDKVNNVKSDFKKKTDALCAAIAGLSRIAANAAHPHNELNRVSIAFEAYKKLQDTILEHVRSADNALKTFYSNRNLFLNVLIGKATFQITIH